MYCPIKVGMQKVGTFPTDHKKIYCGNFLIDLTQFLAAFILGNLSEYIA